MTQYEARARRSSRRQRVQRRPQDATDQRFRRGEDPRRGRSQEPTERPEQPVVVGICAPEGRAKLVREIGQDQAVEIRGRERLATSRFDEAVDLRCHAGECGARGRYGLSRQVRRAFACRGDRGHIGQGALAATRRRRR